MPPCIRHEPQDRFAFHRVSIITCGTLRLNRYQTSSSHRISVSFSCRVLTEWAVIINRDWTLHTCEIHIYLTSPGILSNEDCHHHKGELLIITES